MCPHGYHHSGSMATPSLGTLDVRYIYIYMCVVSNGIYVDEVECVNGLMINCLA